MDVGCNFSRWKQEGQLVSISRVCIDCTVETKYKHCFGFLIILLSCFSVKQPNETQTTEGVLLSATEAEVGPAKMVKFSATYC